MYKFDAFINNKFVDLKENLEIISPIDNKVVGTVKTFEKKDIDDVFQNAKKAFENWKKYDNISFRIECVQKITKLLNDNIDEMAEIMYQEIAKPKADGIVEIKRTIDYINKTIEIYQNLQKDKMIINDIENKIYYMPLGVVLAISPFNYPINLAFSKIAPALISGNTVVFKPATNGSLVASFFAKLISKIKLPPGVFNLVTGRGSKIGNYIISHEHVDMISFTGSVEIGNQILQNKKGIPIVLELGGNDAAYVRYDANLELAAKEIAKGAFNFAGQRCTAIKRLILHQKIKKHFLKLLLEEVKKIQNVPLVSSGAANFVMDIIKDSYNRKENFILSGKRKINKIDFHIVETSINSKVWQEEAFGPVLPLITIDDESKLIKIFNDTIFGLQNSIFTSDLEWGHQQALMIESGSVNINRSSARGPDEFPFLGLKKSGFGVQGIKHSLLSMTRILNVIIKK